MTTRNTALQSLVTFRNSQGEAARGTLVKLDRTTVIFEVYNPYSIVQLSEVLQQVTIRRGERVIYEGSAVVSNLVNTGLMLIVSTKLLDPWSGLSSFLRENDFPGLQLEVQRFVDDWDHANRLRSSFLVAVHNLRSFLGELSRWLGQFDVEYMHNLPNDAVNVTGDILDRLSARLFPRMNELFRCFEYEAGCLATDEVDQHRAAAQRDLHPLLLGAPFLNRTFYKPLGYAGDYEMMNMIQRDPAEGPSTYAKLVNSLFLHAAIPQSVRNRTEMLADYLRKEAERIKARGEYFKVLNIGCGPAIEVQSFVARTDGGSPCSFTLLDFNAQTLAYAKERIDSLTGNRPTAVSITYVHESIHNLLKQPANPQQRREEYDFVYCSGLFDYLSDKVCARLLRLFYSFTRPGGLVLVTNMHSSNPEKFIMDNLMEWYLIYRDERTMDSLSPSLGTHRVFRDETGVNVCLEVRKTRPV